MKPVNCEANPFYVPQSHHYNKGNFQKGPGGYKKPYNQGYEDRKEKAGFNFRTNK